MNAACVFLVEVRSHYTPSAATAQVESARTDWFQAGCSRVHAVVCRKQHRRTSSMNSTVRPILRTRSDVYTVRLASVTDCPTHTPVDHQRSVVSSRRSLCLEQSSTSCHGRTASDCIPKSSEDLSLQSFFSVTSLGLYHIFVVPAQWPFVISDTLTVLFTFYVGSRAFPVACPRIWNALPQETTSAQSPSLFRQRLKSHLFRRSYPDLDIWCFVLSGCFLCEQSNLEVYSSATKTLLIDWLIGWFTYYNLVVT